MIPPVVETHVFAANDFVGGDAVLDFVNTVTGRDETPRDWLDGYPRLVAWSAQAKLLPDETLHALQKIARTNPASARAALRRAKQLREALFLITTAMITGRAPPKSATELLTRYWQAAAAAREVRYAKRDVRLAMRADAIDLDLIACTIAYRFVENILPESRGRLRICAGTNCSWLFLDRSKAGRRRWCDMAVCGNTAKSRRFYARTRTSTRRTRSPVRDQ